MDSIRKELVFAELKKADASVDYNIYNTREERYEFKRKKINANESLTKDEKSYVVRLIDEEHDRYKILYNEGKKRICKDCKDECLATLYCEHCLRNYLKENFSNWTSGNDAIDDLIQKCQMESYSPYSIIEWIPYKKFQNIEYQTKGGCSEIYTAEWIDGSYDQWDSEEKQLKRFGTESVILKELKDVKNAHRSWVEEAKSHLTISNKWSNSVAKCYGLTQSSLNGNYMLVMFQFNINLREYLQQNNNQLTWKKKTKIIYDIIKALYRIHAENSIHKDLHSGNMLYSQYNDFWYVSDFGFCGPPNKQSGCIYGNLPYIAPEVIAGKEYTYASDIYSFGILMWEISAGQPPFSDYDDYDLAINIINGIRPKTISGIPSEYKDLMEQCWDADPTKRPDIITLKGKMRNLRNSFQDENNDQPIDNIDNSTNINNINDSSLNASKSSTNSLVSKSSTSKVYMLKDMPEPRNATKEEQEAYHNGRQYNILDEENNEKNNKLKRSFSNNSDDEEEDSVNKPKKINLGDSEGYHSRQYDFDI